MPQRGLIDMDEVELGPIGYLVVEFREARLTGEGMAELLELTARGIIRILDLVFVMKSSDGTVNVVQVADLDGDGELDLAVFEGASSQLLDEDDVAEAGQVIAAGSAAGILLYENTWAAPFARALRRNGAELVASGHVPLDQVSEALDLTEAAG